MAARTYDLDDLTSYTERAAAHLDGPERDEMVTALRRVWLRNRLPQSLPSPAVADIATHCTPATLAALVEAVAR